MTRVLIFATVCSNSAGCLVSREPMTDRLIWSPVKVYAPARARTPKNQRVKSWEKLLNFLSLFERILRRVVTFENNPVS
jgi:hypothetical protein